MAMPKIAPPPKPLMVSPASALSRSTSSDSSDSTTLMALSSPITPNQSFARHAPPQKHAPIVSQPSSKTKRNNAMSINHDRSATCPSGFLTTPVTSEGIYAQNLPPVQWDAGITAAPDELDACSRELVSVALGAVRCAAYFHTRALGQDHAQAVRASNRAIRTIAKTLGFAYPKSHELTF